MDPQNGIVSRPPKRFLRDHHVALQVNHLGLPLLPSRDLRRVDKNRVTRFGRLKGDLLRLRRKSDRSEHTQQQRAKDGAPLLAVATGLRSNDGKMTQVKFLKGR